MSKKKQGNEIVAAMNLLEEEKGISREVIKDALEQALVLAYKRNYDQASNVEVVFDSEKGTITVYSLKEVVEEKEDDLTQVSLSEALEINKAYELGDIIRFEVTPKDFGRIATQTAKHVVMQRIREAERDIIYDEFIQYEDEILTGVVERQDQRFVYVKLGRAEAVMPVNEQLPTENYKMGERIKVYVTKVDKTNRGPQIVVSRAHPSFLKRLFEQEVPEIYEGVVEIKAIAREAGDRSKVAVYSRDSQVDPVGTCVGPRGSRVQSIVYELNGENMDIVEWDEDPVTFVTNAMSPADVLQVDFLEEDESCIVVVPEDQLSLAIGKRGQNARLAARLTGLKIDIKSNDEYLEYLKEQELASLEHDQEVVESEFVTDEDIEDSEDEDVSVEATLVDELEDEDVSVDELDEDSTADTSEETDQEG